MDFIFFRKSSLKNRSQIQIFRILERERERFLKVFSRKLQILKLNKKLTSGPKILKIWI
jgi:hypothetical protein